MTNKEAAEIVRTFREVMDTPITEHRDILLGALDMAINALERDGWLDYDECGTTCLSCPVCGAVWRKKK